MQFQKVHAQLLQRHHLFSPIPEQGLQELMRTARIISTAKDEFLFQQGERATAFYFVISGRIKLFRTLPDGTEKIIELVAEDQTFAEALMFRLQDSYPVSAQATEPTQLFGFTSCDYLKLLKGNNELCLALLGNLSVRLRNRLNEIEVLSLKNSTHRVVRYLMTQLAKIPDQQREFSLPVTKRLIAAQLSIQPETFSRIIHKLRDEGIINLKGKQVTVLDRERLENYE